MIFFQNQFFKYFKCAHETGRKSLTNPVDSYLFKVKSVQFSSEVYLEFSWKFCLLSVNFFAKKFHIVDVWLGSQYLRLWIWCKRHQSNDTHVVLVPLLLTLKIFLKLVFMQFDMFHTNFRTSCFHNFEQVNAIWEAFQKSK